MTSAEIIIKTLKLKPHPEGGFFKETYRSEGIINKDSLPKEYSGSRNYSTSIYFLLTSGEFSAFHKVIQDEIWHFYSGSSLLLCMIDAKGKYSEVRIGRNVTKRNVPQFVVKGGTWFAARVIDDCSYSLLGCTVSPGFDFSDFTLAKRKDLIRKFPQHEDIIMQLTRK